MPVDRIMILDGAMGTMIQKYGLREEDYHADLFADVKKELHGNNECLNITRPDIIKSIHKAYIAAGADIIETNTFSANRISQEEYGCRELAYAMAFEGARIAREAADEAAGTAASIGIERKVLVAGSMGPTSKSLSLATDSGNPSYRPYSFQQLKETYKEQAEALLKGGADLILIETCFDALNVKAALAAIAECRTETGLPEVMSSVSVGDRSGRTLTGQTLEAFYEAVSHYPILSFGLNCSLGASQMKPLVEDISRWCRCRISCHPNAGLPNEMGGYDQSPEDMAAQMKDMARNGLLNIVGGCCGTTPEHIKAIAEAVKGLPPHKVAECHSGLTVSGLEAVSIDTKRNNFTNIGERTNVAGSRKFARLIAQGEYDQALRIAAKQIEDGARIIDINMDDAMLDSSSEMERFLRHISNDPDVAKAAIMIDSSHWETILTGLYNAQGKCIVNSISLKDGEEEFIRKASAIKSFGAAVVVMAFDESGQATTYDRKIEICSRAYRLLTEKAGFNPSDIIFDANILSIGTGIKEHSRYAIDFIEAVRWIKENLPGALTSGGVSNLSFAFRGNNSVREAMHSAFLYHAIRAGLDMAIVNPSMLRVYDDIEPGLLRCVEDVIFDKDPDATERLTDKASAILAAEGSATPGTSSVVKETAGSPEERLKDAIIKGRTDGLDEALAEAMQMKSRAVDIIEGPLMDGMKAVGDLFGEGKMFLPQVVKSAKVMRDAVTFLEPHIRPDKSSGKESSRHRIVLATVKGDVHDIGKNITGIVLTCNGFEVHDLGVMVDKETIIEEALRTDADIIAVSGLITPSLYQMEELCRELSARGMDTPLFIGGATTSALHTAVKLAPLYDHVFYGPDASATAVMAKRCMIDRAGFEMQQHEEQEKLRNLHDRGQKPSKAEPALRFPLESFVTDCPSDIPVRELSLTEVMPYFDWRMFYAIWGVKYSSSVPEAMELMQLRADAEDELALGDFRILISARFFPSCSTEDDRIEFTADGTGKSFPMLRQENGRCRSLADFVIPSNSGKKSVFGMFAASVHKKSKAHVHGCSCPACSNAYEDMIGKAVRMTLAEAASAWLDRQVDCGKVIKPAAGYSSCPDHTLKKDILDLLGNGLGIELTESYAMTPESSICGLVFIHPEACYPEIRKISAQQYDGYASRRGMDKESAHRFLGHLL